MRSLRRWKWGTLNPYNGFSHEERVQVWQLQSAFTDNGWWEKPKVCSITGREDHVALHSEDYYHWPTSSFTIQQGVHLVLHARFRNPAAWLKTVDQYASTGDEWFARLPMTPVNLAGSLRAKHGAQVTELFANAPWPEGVTVPHEQIYRQAVALPLEEAL